MKSHTKAVESASFTVGGFEENEEMSVYFILFTKALKYSCRVEGTLFRVIWSEGWAVEISTSISHRFFAGPQCPCNSRQLSPAVSTKMELLSKLHGFYITSTLPPPPEDSLYTRETF